MHSSPRSPAVADDDLPDLVRAELVSFFEARQAALRTSVDEFAEATDSLIELVLGGGKRLRPTFAWWGWRAAGGEPSSPQARSVLRAASALELIQGCALVHDDLMDDSPRRRGLPTVHVTFAERHRRSGWATGSDRFGMAAAVLLGDLSLAWADDMLRESGLSTTAAARAARPWQAMRTEMLAGQYLDMLAQVRGDEDPETALRIDRLKSAAYTVERPLHLGAAIAGAPPEVVDGLRAYGRAVGVAFQLRDDQLGVFGDPAVTGKPAGDDLREGKRTLLMSIGMRRAAEQANDSASAILRAAVGNAELDEDGVAAARAVLLDLGAVAEVEEEIDRLTDQASTELATTPITSVARERLIGLAASATRRDH
ncbi:geranylgeranyl diphosphate synthase type I [Actinoalloteichus hoggarensis]|uniref:(2E,6E)-farnesyl diphosphate synthase n=1 Tax=Actinoalloteichus hoggarensis TaxID=1470176 RepID=A0A221W8A5_9PSEU|nr:polyprenyl synthetase family protein [Actinoalloteichus hoggarensis]ASO22148.1 (2E,6E)-farnesyl diphosphate synthase [Actinoalloteichus hoggarensis]MBB5923770.1 geranylgeranyl diphosphate synthase type I [Actinoalloteichus hoggarensis]